MSPGELCVGCMESRSGAPLCPRCGWDEARPIASPLFLPPRTVLVKRYIVGRVVGYGGFGINYLGFDTKLRCKVALKEYLPAGVAARNPGELEVTVPASARDEFDSGLARARMEMRFLSRLRRHPGVVHGLDFVRANGTAYLVTGYIPGRTLEDYLHTFPRIPFEPAMKIMTSLMETLRHVHRNGILHCDTSPDNILLCDDGAVKLLDFGAARPASSRRSRQPWVILKDGYAPKEQYSSRGNHGPWTDVYAVAATMYRALTGEAPPAALDREVDDRILPPSALGVQLPSYAEAALMRALSVEASGRFQSIEEFQIAITGKPGCAT